MLAATLVAVGCYGGRNDMPEGQSGTDGTGGTGADESGGEADEDSGGVPEGCEPTAQPIRRLSHAEYRNTLRDLVGEQALPAELSLAADPRVGGFSNNAAALAPSDLLTRQYYEAARTVARSLDVATLSPCSADEAGCDEQFVRWFGLRAFRRPLEDDEVERMMALYDAGGSFEVGAQLVVQAMLQSADFLYRPELGAEDGRLTGYETASRLSYFLWATMPDEALLTAAADGELDTQAGVEAQVARMLADPKARDGLLLFHREWLDLERIGHVLKLPEEGFDQAYAHSMQESAERFVWETLYENGGSLDELLTSPDVPVDATMAALLGVDAPADGWETVSLDPAQRAGILTHPAVLASHAYAGYPSPVLRGVFVLDRVLCAPPSPPPAGVDTTLPDPDDAAEPQTNRQWYEGATIDKGEQCAGCHVHINGVGYAFEHYDSMGRYRTLDNGQPVDASGASFGLEYGDAVQMSTLFATNERFSECVVHKWTQYATGGVAGLGGGCVRDDLAQTLVDTDMSAVELVAALAMHPMYARAPIAGEE